MTWVLTGVILLDTALCPKEIDITIATLSIMQRAEVSLIDLVIQGFQRTFIFGIMERAQMSLVEVAVQWVEVVISLARTQHMIQPGPNTTFLRPQELDWSVFLDGLSGREARESHHRLEKMEDLHGVLEQRVLGGCKRVVLCVVSSPVDVAWLG